MKLFDMFQYFTTYNVCVTIIVKVYEKRTAGWVFDIVRGTALLVASAVAYFYVVYGPRVILSMYERIFPSRSTLLYLLFDWVIHFVPVLVLGLPRHVASLPIAYSLLLSWYAFMRANIPNIYFHSVSMSEYDTLIAVLGVFVLVYSQILVNSQTHL
jgi:hypothetical protein